MTRNNLAKILKGKGTEMFSCDDEALIVHNRQVLEVEEAPLEIKGKILKFIRSDKNRESAYKNMAGPDENAQISQCIKCMFANLDGVPDIDENGNISSIEYVPCSKRGGECKYEGIACNRFEVGNGNTLSKGELRVLELYPLEEKEIAEKLFISPATVHRHSQNMRIKTGIPSGKMLALWGFNKGVINQEQLWSY